MSRARDIDAFRATVLDHYREHGRHDLPWRLTSDPYAILVSEVMLQQTQVPRVVPHYLVWLREFPTFEALAAAPLAVVLERWQGLGYNRTVASELLDELTSEGLLEREGDRYSVA